MLSDAWYEIKKKRIVMISDWELRKLLIQSLGILSRQKYMILRVILQVMTFSRMPTVIFRKPLSFFFWSAREKVSFEERCYFTIEMRYNRPCHYISSAFTVFYFPNSRYALAQKVWLQEHFRSYFKLMRLFDLL